MDTTTTKKVIRETVAAALSGRASALTLERVDTILDQLPEDRAGMANGLRKVRVAVRLFVDEDLADLLYEDLRKIVDP